MLMEFRVRNFACYRDWQTLSLVASADRSLPENTMEVEGTKQHLLRSAVIYGANASGKTKLLDSLAWVLQFVRRTGSTEDEREPAAIPFRFSKESVAAPSEFEITFIHQGVRYQYGIAVAGRKVLSEYLFAAPKGRTVPYYQRRWDEEKGDYDYDFGSSLKGQNERIRRLVRENVTYLAVAAAFDHEILRVAYEGMRAIIGVQAYLIWPSPRRLEQHHASVTALLRYADLGVTDFSVSERQQPGIAAPDGDSGEAHSDANVDSDTKAYLIELLHRAGVDEPSTLPLSWESNGTIRMLSIAVPILDALDLGHTLYVDELGASMHPLMARSIVELFHNPRTNPKGAQIIFNTHDTTMLDTTLFRRDQIWFTEKDAHLEAHLYALSEYGPRKDEPLAKAYLQGRYGAIPFLGDPTEVFSVEAEGNC